VDATRPDGGETLGIVERLKKSSRRAVLVLNKIDLVSRETLLPAVAAFDQDGIFDATYLVSASTGDGVADLRKALAANVPTSPHLFPEDQLTDLPQRLLAAEITREQVFLQLHEEVPYSVAVETENWTERPDGSVRIDQVIYVMRDGQKAIVLGKGGSRIKTLGQSSRKELEAVLDRRVHLFLYVKVRQNWAEDPGQFREWGLDYNV
ncbi:MAG: GTPase Era, partial [Rhodospirillales bacterium]